MSCWSSIEGTWSYRDLIGSRFKLKSISFSLNKSLKKDCQLRFSEQELTLEEVYFRVTTDGKVFTLFKMKEVCGTLFLPRDVELLDINPVDTSNAVTGQFICGKVIVGNGTENTDTSTWGIYGM
jgi:hypothetical protein